MQDTRSFLSASLQRTDPATLHGLTHGMFDSGQRPVHRGLHGLVAFLDIDTGQTFQDHLDPAALVASAARPVLSLVGRSSIDLHEIVERYRGTRPGLDQLELFENFLC